jgi:hypothetical protein
MQGLVDWVATSWEQIKKAQSSKVAGLLYAIPEHPKRPPDAGHGALFQVPKLFVAHTEMFLDA